MARLNPCFRFTELSLKRSCNAVLFLSLVACSMFLVGCDTVHQASAASSTDAIPQAGQSISLSASLNPGNVGTSYQAVLSVSGGEAPYHFALAQGALPAGLALNAETGTISGTPTQAGSSTFTISATDGRFRDTGAHSYTMMVNPCANCVTVQISPPNPSVAAGGKLQFSALVSNTSNTAVTWSATGGAISNTGLFTAPNANAGSVFQIVATSLAHSSAKGSATLAIAAPSSAPGNPGSGNPGSGTPPPAPTPSPASTPTPSGADNRYCNPGDVPSFGTADGLAATPTSCFHTAESSTPSTGAVIQVAAGSNLQTVINNASCGDTLVLQAGRTYPGFTLPAKNCDANRYITIRSSGAGSGLPAEGVRATPCNAGVASLPGRPALNCTSTSKVMAQIAGVAKNTRIISTDAGANYYRLVGLEVADTEANGADGGYYDLVMLINADHIIFDRCWIHGSPIGEDVKGVEFTDSSYIAVIDSYISDIHSKVSGYGADSAAIGSVTGTGPVKIVDNFLEASGENILWGGAASTTNISDVEIRRNHMFKPFTWWTSSPTYIRTLFVTKNLFESKSGVREFVEGNIFEDNWAQAQKGTAILFGPKNQYGQCPGCTVHDVIFRYNIVRHAVNAIGMAVVYATTCPGEAGDSKGKCLYESGGLYNLSIHDNLLDDINETTYAPGQCCSNGYLFALNTNQPVNWPHDITIDHNTGFPVGSGIASVIMNGAPEVFSNFSFNNNLMTSGEGGFNEVLPGDHLPGCGEALGSGMVGALNGCMGNTWTAAGNVFANTSKSSKLPGSPIPPRNLEAPNGDSLGFMEFNNGNGGNYRLAPNSRFANAGTDGKDPGASMDEIEAATAGVL
jgi:Putative Ig domain